ncbi:hypothetical protein [Caudoviricetes sp.]|nr:hypothetical protein [Caudoviricetes sp.]
MARWRSHRDWFDYEFELETTVGELPVLAVGEAVVEYVAEPPDASVGEIGPSIQTWVTHMNFSLYGEDDVEVLLDKEQVEQVGKQLRMQLEKDHEYEMYEKAQENLEDVLQDL